MRASAVDEQVIGACACAAPGAKVCGSERFPEHA